MCKQKYVYRYVLETCIEQSELNDQSLLVSRWKVDLKWLRQDGALFAQF